VTHPSFNQRRGQPFWPVSGSYKNGSKRILVIAFAVAWASGLATPGYHAFCPFDGLFVDGIPTYPYTRQFDSLTPFWGMCAEQLDYGPA
jgi:hypothetical protein